MVGGERVGRKTVAEIGSGFDDSDGAAQQESDAEPMGDTNATAEEVHAAEQEQDAHRPLHRDTHTVHAGKEQHAHQRGHETHTGEDARGQPACTRVAHGERALHQQ